MSSKPKSKSRRRFLLKGGLGTIGILALGTFVMRNPIRRKILEVAETMVPPYMGSGTEANLWFELLENNKLKIHSPKVEMGQGTFTGIAQIVADELDFDIDDILISAAETATGIVDQLSTGGSLSIAQLWEPLREMSATMRELIKEEAIKKLGGDISKVYTKNGKVYMDKISMSYAKALEGTVNFELPKKAPLKSLEDYKYIGKPIKRIDLLQKVVGHPIFGMDAEMPDMLHATVIRPEHIGSSIKSIDYSEVEKMPGVVKVVKGDGWLGIIADSFSQALTARRTVKVEWDIPKVWTEDELRDYLKVGEGSKMMTQKVGDKISDDESNIFEMEFTSPIGAHAQIEPNGAVAYVKDDKVTVKLSTQVIGVTQKQVAEALGVPKENVNIIATYLGGGFGRRLNTSHAIHAALMSKEVGRPVKYFLTRKEEFQNDTFRPPTHHKVKAVLKDNGDLEKFEHHYASGDVATNAVIMPPGARGILGTDVGAMRGGNIMYDKIPNHRVIQWHKTLPFATSWWRSLGLLANTFAIESFMDEMALKAGKDPFDFRLEYLSDSNPYSKRIKSVIQKLKNLVDYKPKISDTKGMGFAASIDAGSPCAQVFEVSIIDNRIKVEKVVCVFDCGLAVNPDQVKAQCEGSIIMGISASLHEKMEIKDGRLYPINYGAYDMALMRDTPKEIDIHLIQGVDIPLPVGEPPLGPVGAAISNAVRNIKGIRLTDLPMKLV